MNNMGFSHHPNFHLVIFLILFLLFHILTLFLFSNGIYFCNSNSRHKNFLILNPFAKCVIIFLKIASFFNVILYLSPMLIFSLLFALLSLALSYTFPFSLSHSQFPLHCSVWTLLRQRLLFPADGSAKVWYDDARLGEFFCALKKLFIRQQQQTQILTFKTICYLNSQ